MKMHPTYQAARGPRPLSPPPRPRSAQFATSVTRPLVLGNFPPNTNSVDVFVTTPDGTDTFIFDGDSVPSSSAGFGGLAADEPGRQLFASVRNGPDEDLYSIDYDTRTEKLIGEVFIIDTAGQPDPVSINGLAYDTTRGVLYGSRTLGGTTGPEGLFAIDTTTAQATLVFEFETPSTSLYQFDGIDYDAATDRIYLADDDTTGGQGIYSLDPADFSQPLSLVAPYISPINDVDGLGAGDGLIYLLSDSPEGNGGNHYVYDLTTGEYSIFAQTPYDARPPSSLGPVNPSGGGAYAPGLIPEPTTTLAAFVAGRLDAASSWPVKGRRCFWRQVAADLSPRVRSVLTRSSDRGPRLLLCAKASIVQPTARTSRAAWIASSMPSALTSRCVTARTRPWSRDRSTPRACISRTKSAAGIDVTSKKTMFVCGGRTRVMPSIDDKPSARRAALAWSSTRRSRW